MAELRLSKNFIYSSKRWREIDDFLSGEHPQIANADYLVRMEVEKSDKTTAIKAWQRRLDTLDYFNHTKLVQDIHLSALSQEVIFLGMDTDDWQILLDDVTGYGVSAETFIRFLLQEFLAHGQVGVFIDSPKETSDSTADRSFLINKKAYDILSFDHFNNGIRRGDLKEVYFYDGTEVINDKEKAIVLRLFLEDENASVFSWERYTAKNEKSLTLGNSISLELFESGQGSLSIIPFIIIGRGLEDSALKDVQSISKNRLNKKSALDNILYYQGFQRIHGFGINGEEAKFLAENTLSFSESTDGRFQVIDSADPQALERDVQKLDKIAFRIGLKQKNIMADDTRQVQSAEAKSKDADSLNDYYDFILDQFERQLTLIFQIQGELEGFNNLDQISINFVRNYRSEQTEQELAERQLVYSQAQQLGVLEVQKEILKQGIAKLKILPGKNQTEKERIQELLDAVDAIDATVNPFTQEVKEETPTTVEQLVLGEESII